MLFRYYVRSNAINSLLFERLSMQAHENEIGKLKNEMRWNMNKSMGWSLFTIKYHVNVWLSNHENLIFNFLILFTLQILRSVVQFSDYLI